MGYNSDFVIEIKGFSKGFSCDHKGYPEDSVFCPYCGVKIGSIDAIQTAIEEISQYYIYQRDPQTLSVSDSKWYEWKNNLQQISEKFDCLFTVMREGEETLDIEKCYFYKGNTFNPGKVIITFENDTEEKRKEALGI